MINPIPGLSNEDLAMLDKLNEEGQERRARREVSKLVSSGPVSSVVSKLGKSIYPWSLWQNGKYHVANRDVDYFIATGMFQITLHQRAAVTGMVVKTEKLGPDSMGFLFSKSKAELLTEWARLGSLTQAELEQKAP